MLSCCVYLIFFHANTEKINFVFSSFQIPFGQSDNQDKRYSTPPYFISLCLFKRIVLSNYFGMTNCGERASGGLRSNEEDGKRGFGWKLRGERGCTVSNRRDKVSTLGKPGLKTFRPVERFNYGCFFAFPYSKYQTVDCFIGFIINPRVCSLS